MCWWGSRFASSLSWWQNLLVILVYVKFQETFNSELWNSEDTFSSSKASRETTKNEGGRADSESAAMPAAGAAAVAVAVDSETENVGTELKATNVYSDVETPFLILLVYGAAQIMLVVFYIYSLYTNGRPDFTSTDTYIFYFAGCLFQIIRFSKHQNGDAQILSNIRQGTLFKDDKPVVVAEWEIFVRQVLDLAINVCAALVIYLSLPLQLAGTSTTYFDFLLNSCATVFILELSFSEKGCTYILKSLAQAEEWRATKDLESAAIKCERSASDSMASSSTQTPAPKLRGVPLL